ncbi:RimK family alpha-L-glutamate ligase [Stieleria sp. JC731]|uniref:ATP-grasp domain-containing protein n=1 Tax=Pirellulaceae TaxID=2691357 RepID=UPI001E37FBFE|nr:RimK family alpha-L-glutamate ligase [Stieleria sp. JC731]MCC9602013.1 RimK family alpha-L-glutamate ligase [Stieleria sp. JC731]
MSVGRLPVRFLVLGPDQGWHANQLRTACRHRGIDVDFAAYESLRSTVDQCPRNECTAGSLESFDAILTRTMPAASMEQLTYRLAVLHSIADNLGATQTPIVNSPRGLEWAIDKFATSIRLASLGYPVPETHVVQNRNDALAAFDSLGGDCVIKPIFGGEGRGVMRVQDRELAWTCFSTLEQLQASIVVQRFVSPGGRDTRLLVIGDRVLGFRRTNEKSFRTNVAGGATCDMIAVDSKLSEDALRITGALKLEFASVDIIDNDNGPPLFLEVNAIPGWKGAQTVCGDSIAEMIIERLWNLSDKTSQ